MSMRQGGSPTKDGGAGVFLVAVRRASRRTQATARMAVADRDERLFGHVESATKHVAKDARFSPLRGATRTTPSSRTARA